jgi:CelD/BcsL family acetyltransferase involved in cellulose biosynthesis
MDGLLEEAVKAALISVYSWPPILPALQQGGFRLHDCSGVIVVDLSVGIQKLFDDFPKNRRRDIRLALRSGVGVSEQTTAEELKEYWEVYSAWQRICRKQIQGSGVSFETIVKAFSLRQNRRLFLARKDGKLIAASTIRFAAGGLIEYASNCSLDEYLRFLPNDLLLWRIFEWGCENGYKKCSLGSGDPFARKWSTSIIPVHRYRLDRTLLRRHDLKEEMQVTAHKLFRRMPGLKGKVGHLLRHGN